MTVERALFIMAGTIVMLSSMLAMFHHPYWGWLTLFVGFNMFQSAFTGFCPAAIVMKKLGLKKECETGCAAPAS